MSEKKQNLILLLFVFLIFISMFLFFFRVHPLYLFDSDDWKYAVYTRLPIPIWKDWNPTRVLPEILMSFIARLGSLLIYPITNDFIKANAVANAIVVGLAISLYVYSFNRLLRLRYETGFFVSLGLSLLFLLLHFWIFRYKMSSNQYMFKGHDLCCFYYYTISNLLNASLVMCFMVKDYFDLGVGDIKKNPVKYIVFSILIYFSVFSNLYAGIILAVFVGLSMLRDAVDIFIRKSEKSKWCIVRRIVYLLVWLMAQVFEYFGGRATEINKAESLAGLFLKQSSKFISLRERLNKGFIVFVLSVIILWIVLSIYRFIILHTKKPDSENSSEKSSVNRDINYDKPISLLALIFSLIYLIMVSAKHYIGSIRRPDILFGAVFFGFLLIMLCMNDIFENVKHSEVLLPILIIIAFLCTDTRGRTFKETNLKDIKPEAVLAADNDMIERIKTADISGEDEIELLVPDFGTKSNWPFLSDHGELVADALYKYRVTSRRINIKRRIPTSDKNKEFGMKEY